MKLRIAICDDEKAVLDSEANIIENVLLKNGIFNTVEKFNDPQLLLKSAIPYDIIFLDIKMDSINGIEVAKEIKKRSNSCLIFFLTKYEEYLDEAFNQHAFRYWKKPLDENKLLYGIESAIRELKESKQVINIHIKNETIQILAKNIIYFYVNLKLLHIVSVNGEIYADDTYHDIYEQLRNFPNFCEPRRGYCVNFMYVKDYNTDSLVCAYHDKTYKINISRRKYSNFNLSYVNWIGGKY
jgi:DNA-binding LytR/AlgR family response regulator